MNPFKPVSNQETIIVAWRHGETLANTNKLLSGGSTEDPRTDLTDKGREQAKQLGQIIHELGYNLKVIYSSDMTRAIDTAKAVSNGEIDIIPLTDLREILHGRWQMTHAEDRRKAITTKFNNEIKKIREENISFDKYHFWKLHPFGVEEALIPQKVIDVKKYLENENPLPETSYQNYKRFKATLIKIAKDHPGETIGCSNHGASLTHYNAKHAERPDGQFLPPFFMTEQLKDEGKIALIPEGAPVLPTAARVGNCDLFIFKYDHETNKLSQLSWVKHQAV